MTLAESQGKKAAFLSELVRTLGLSSKVHAGRVASLPPGRRFDAVTLRAVDRMEEACLEARGRVTDGGWLAVMTTQTALRAVAPTIPAIAWRHPVALPGSDQGVVALGRALDLLKLKVWNVPRGTFLDYPHLNFPPASKCSTWNICPSRPRTLL